MNSLDKVFIWIDDERNIDFTRVPKGMEVVHVKSYKEAIKELQFFINSNSKLILTMTLVVRKLDMIQQNG